MRKKKRDNTIVSRFPAEFIEVVDLNTLIRGHKNRTEYLRELSKEIKPKAKDLKKRGLLSDEEDLFM